MTKASTSGRKPGEGSGERTDDRGPHGEGRRLERRERAFRLLADHAPALVSYLDPELRYRFVNAHYPRLLQRSREKIVGREVREILGEVTFERVRSHFERAMSGRKVSFEVFLPEFPTGAKWLAGLFVPDVNDAGELNGIFVFINDITGHKRTEEELLASRQMLQMVLDTIPARVFWKDRELRYLGCNRAFLQDARLVSADQILGRDDHALEWYAQAEQYRRDDHEVIETGRPKLNYEEPQNLPDGTRRMLRTSKIPLRNAAGDVVGVLGSYEDITEQRELETQLRQSQKMEALGQLAGGVAHDFNNLLTAILGYADLALRRCPPQGRLRDELQEICRAAGQGSALTRQLLAFTRQQVLEPRVVDLNAVVGNVERLLRRTIGENVRLETRLAPAPVKLRADSGQLEQILINLAVNARDAMPEGGSLTVETATVGLRPGEQPGLMPGSYARLRVSDTGVGMDDVTRGRIFEPFFTTKDLGYGTGLGLSTVYGIVKQSEGEIAVASAPGKGATFTIHFPHDDGLLEAGVPAGVVADHVSGSEVVLLVEDDDTVRALTRDVLVQDGYRVLEADAPSRAMELCELHPGTIHLLVTDLILPGMSGLDLVRRLRARRPETRVLAISGYTDRVTFDGRPLGLELPFLQKPFRPGELLRKVRDVLESAVPRAPGSSDTDS